MKDDISQQQKALIQTSYLYMSRGILRNSRLQFALHLVHKMFPKYITDEVCYFHNIMVERSMIKFTFQEWKLFLGSSAHLNKEDTGGIPLWIPDQHKTKVKMLLVKYVGFAVIAKTILFIF